jgi:hypothetical protein
MGEMVTDAVLCAKIPARDHSRLSRVQYGRILVAATVESDFSGLCPDHELCGSNAKRAAGSMPKATRQHAKGHPLG